MPLHACGRVRVAAGVGASPLRSRSAVSAPHVHRVAAPAPAHRRAPVAALHALRAAGPVAVARRRERRSRGVVASGPDDAADVAAAASETEALVAEAQRVLNVLYTRRDMTPNEVRLVLMIEDPRAARRRQEYGIEVESGVSRDDLVAALTEVQAGRVPQDELALAQLVTELQAWPYLEGDEVLRAAAGEPSSYAAVTNTGLSEAARRAQAARARSAADEEEVAPEKDLSDFLPKWVGFSAVYLVSAIPVFITLAVLALLFVTSLK